MLSVLLIVILAVAAISVFGALALPVVIAVFAYRFVKRKFLGDGDTKPKNPLKIEGKQVPQLHSTSRRGCPTKENAELRGMQRRLETVRRHCHEALDKRIASQVARSRILPPLEDAYAQIKAEIDAIYAFCERNDLTGTLRKAKQSASAGDIYREAYERNLGKVRAAIDKTEECLAAYERTVATLEVSSVEADITSDFDQSIEMLRDLRKELPLYSLEDRV